MTDESRAEAERSLKRWGLDPCDEKLIMLHGACQQHCNARVSRKMFEKNNVKEEVRSETETSHTVHLVPRGNLAPADKKAFPGRATIEELVAAKCLYDSFANVPKAYTGCLVVDRCIPLEKLGPGVLDHKIAVSHLKKIELSSEITNQDALEGSTEQKALMDKPADDAMPAAPGLPTGSLQLPVGAKASAPVQATAPANFAAGGLLDAGHSDLLQGKDAFEGIAAGLKDCFKNGRFEATEANDTDNVENKVKDFVRFARQEAKAKPDQPVPEFMHHFVGFVVKQLFKSTCYHVLPKVVPALLLLQAIHNDYKDENQQEARLLKALGLIAGFKIGSTGEVGLDFLQPGEKTLVDNSVMFRQFLRENIQALVSALVSAFSLSDSDRYHKAGQFLKSQFLADGSRASLEFGRALLLAAEGEKITFLFKDANHFEQLKAWFGPDAALLSLRCLAANSFKDLSMDAFLKAASMVLPHPQAIDVIKHPIMKAVLTTMSKVRELISKADTKCCPTLCEVLDKEIAVARLGITAVLDSSVVSGFSQLSPEVARALGKLCATLVKQPKADECPTLHAIVATTVVAEIKQGADAVQGSAKMNAESDVKPDASKSDGKAEAPPLDFSVGSKMYVLAAGKYQHWQVEVVKATKIQVKVKVCDGQHKGSDAMLTRAMLGAEIPTVAHAGAKDSDERPSKKQRVEDAAESLDAQRAEQARRLLTDDDDG
eukprot:TRINITY_DN18501_c0_g1_i3.p1 TRINITY_DN18501_c0_g1~~TRINITY_DN18501_c0_g1_i3.p1  ORF type:complete len:749 (-),score=165.68 TRINITY_DN18501_c0_g1_i3:242-2386(-)